MQPIKMKQSINCILLIVSVWTLVLHFSVADQYNYTVGIWGLCGNSGKNEFTNGSVFQGKSEPGFGFIGGESSFDRIQYLQC